MVSRFCCQGRWIHNDDATEIFLSETETAEAVQIKSEIAPEGERIVGVHITSGGSAPNMPPAESKIM